MKPRGSRPRWSYRRDLNPQPADYKSAALPLSHDSMAGSTGFEPVNRCRFAVFKAAAFSPSANSPYCVHGGT